MMTKNMKYDAIIIGAGLTGLSTAFFMQEEGLNVLILEKNNRIGGSICSHSENGFVYEEGPNTGVISTPEVSELFEKLGIEPEIANEDAEKRLILKNQQWHPLPSGAISFLKTPLFTLTDKIKIAFEPLRKKGTDPDESIASLASRRIGQSFVDYAVNPFISGIYAGDPEKLITRYALPKLYNLEQNYGSFIGGSIKKSKEPKSEREKKATKQVFSVKNGFGSLIDTLKEKIGEDHIICNAKYVVVKKLNSEYQVSFSIGETEVSNTSSRVVSTVGAFAVPEMFSFLKENDLSRIAELRYAKVIQVAVGIKKESLSDDFISFGGLIPQKENRRILGVLFPSFCFSNRTPPGFVTLAVYMGGVRHPEFIELSDEKIETIVETELRELMNIPKNSIQFMRIYRHQHAIPQYEKSSGVRFDTVKKIESEHKGLHIAGNLRDGVGIADRIKQAYGIAKEAL